MFSPGNWKFDGKTGELTSDGTDGGELIAGSIARQDNGELLALAPQMFAALCEVHGDLASAEHNILSTDEVQADAPDIAGMEKDNAIAALRGHIDKLENALERSGRAAQAANGNLEDLFDNRAAIARLLRSVGGPA